MQRGFLITFEGLDGSGKTTQLRLLAASLTGAGRPVVTLRQPGSTPLGERLRGLLLDSRSDSLLGPIAPLAELALMFADRAQSLSAVIEPALAAGAIVLCDRFTDSSEAYQGSGRQLGSDRVRALHTALCNARQPDLTLLLLPDFATSLSRARARAIAHSPLSTEPLTATELLAASENRFERQDDAFYARVFEGYKTIAAREPARVALFEDNGTIEHIAAQIAAKVAARVGTRLSPTVPSRPA